MLSRACRTTSTAALQVVAGALPLNLYVTQKFITYKVRKKEYVKWNEYTFVPDDDPDFILDFRKEKIIEIAINQHWQRTWNVNIHGRTLLKFIPDVPFVIDNKWFKPDFRTVQILTGYGSINGTLYNRGASLTPDCPVCNEKEEDIDHMIFECPGYEALRYDRIKNRCNIISLHMLIENKMEFYQFTRFTNELLKIRNS